jgi:D-arabinose 1-dehydrogenase-like Zn-dependent alcohol dehydrogenase
MRPKRPATANNSIQRGLNCSNTSQLVLPPGEFPVALFDVVANCITIRGSFTGTRQDMVEALDFAVGGRVKLILNCQPFHRLIMSRTAQHGDVASRIVLDFTPAVPGRKSIRPARKPISSRRLGNLPE